MGAQKLTAGLNSVIDPLEEAVAYETLLALKDGSEARLEKDFPTLRTPSFDRDQLLREILDVKRENGAAEDIRACHVSVKKHLTSLQTPFGICVRGDFHYQERFKDARIPPRLFYYRGDLNLLETPCVSVVGSRQASAAGLEQASAITLALIKAGYTIVSGLAKGIDTAALEAATRNRAGRVIGVIGTPIDRYYPKDNRGLQDEIAAKHLLISHVPFYRYSRDSFNNRRFYFPRRNAIMSVISQATVIVEASETSGTRSQAEAATHQGRQLFIMESCFKQAAWPSRYPDAIRLQNTDQLIAELPKNPEEKCPAGDR